MIELCCWVDQLCEIDRINKIFKIIRHWFELIQSEIFLLHNVPLSCSPSLLLTWIQYISNHLSFASMRSAQPVLTHVCQYQSTRYISLPSSLDHFQIVVCSPAIRSSGLLKWISTLLGYDGLFLCPPFRHPGLLFLIFFSWLHPVCQDQSVREEANLLDRCHAS